MGIIDNDLFTQTNPNPNSPRNNPSLAGQLTNLNNEVNSIEDTLVQGYVRESASVSYVSSSSFTVSGDVTAIYTNGRIVRFSDGTTGIVSSSSYSSTTAKTTVTMLTGTVPSSLSYVDIAVQPRGQTSGLALRVLGGGNVAFVSHRDSFGTERSVLKVNSSNILEIGDSNLANVKIISPTGSGFTGVDNYPTIVDLTDATSDYDLQIGQKAIINLSNNTSKPLRIATGNGRIYKMIIAPSNNFSNSGATAGDILLQPNNTTYNNAFRNTLIYRDSPSFSSTYATNANAFRIGYFISFINLTIQNFTTAKLIMGNLLMWGASSNFPSIEINISAWNDTTTAWTSLGTLIFPQSTSGKVIVERLA